MHPSSKHTDHGVGSGAFYSKHLTVVIKLLDIVTLEAQILVPVMKRMNAVLTSQRRARDITRLVVSPKQEHGGVDCMF
jgi:hypothetical protein